MPGTGARRRAAASGRGGRAPSKGGTSPDGALGSQRCSTRSSSPHCHVPPQGHLPHPSPSARASTPRPTDRWDVSRTGLEAGPVLVVLCIGQEDPPAPVADTVGAGTALTADRHAALARVRPQSCVGQLGQVSFCGVTDPTSVTQVQPGGSPSSLEPVDVIGSSFPLEATGEAPTAVGTKYPPHPPPCEPHLNWTFS